jgi:hypothetical protein
MVLCRRLPPSTPAVGVFRLTEGAGRCTLLRFVPESPVVPADGGICRTTFLRRKVSGVAPAPGV